MTCITLEGSRPLWAPAEERNAAISTHTVDIAGRWTCRLDPDSRGEREEWFRSPLAEGTLEVSLPGSLQQQGIGDEISLETPWTGLVVDRSFFTDERYAPYREAGNISVPFWLQPEVYYQGAAWFQREIEVPPEWEGREVLLNLERVHWESTVWIDEHRVGTERSLSTAHRHPLGRLSPGRHLLTIRVDNRAVVDVGPNAHSVSDHTQGNWNGIIGELTLTALPAVRLSRVRVFPDLARSSALVKIDIAAGTARVPAGEVRVSARRRGLEGAPAAGPVCVPFAVDYGRDLAERGLTAGGEHLDLELPLGPDAATWDEFDPALYDLDVELVAETNGIEHRDRHSTVFGLREVGVEGTQVTVNGRRTFIRGTLESCVFPLTGYPPTDVGSWRKIMETARAAGLNLLRFHSWCPPEAAFLAADEVGMYLQVEGPVWANQGAAVGEGRPVDAFVHEETRKILREYGNHPSFIMMAHGNEPGGRDAEFLSAWVQGWRQQDPRRLYTTGAGWPAVEQNDFDNIPQPRAHRWGEGLESRLNASPPETLTDYSDWVSSRPRPIISHEIGQWCAYPDLSERAEYTGLMRARNFDIFADFLAQAGMADQAADFLRVSGELQTLCYKEDIETALRTEGFGGFHLLGLTDFPGQGTALVGVLNAFWESKGYCAPEEFARFCGPTVPLARLPRRVFSQGESVVFEVQLAHFGPAPLHGDITWSLRTPQGEERLRGEVARGADIPVGNGTRLGPVAVSLEQIGGPEQLDLVVTVESEDGARHQNDWRVWVYPEQDEPAPEDVHVTEDLQEALDRAGAGERVLLEVPPEEVQNDVALGFTPAFWNTAWTGGQAPHTLGILHDPDHPVFSRFPTRGSTDWQWWELLHGARAMRMEGLPQSLRPLVQPIDTWFEARRLGALFEAKVGRGRLMVSSLNLFAPEERGAVRLQGGCRHRPRALMNLSASQERLAARQFRRSLLAYMASPDFDPQTTLDADQVAGVLG
ncbi:sugar-binding domain-containing protein [Nesterenkonia sp.]|uniref:sugar-binding domain-containing protein n=1 Tax=Nesterenkonia sp. TaxID=704201 RepID=UPI002635F2DB|nr:sugar-binding domain-containing protein [Nesterenkonia sp.]